MGLKVCESQILFLFLQRKYKRNPLKLRLSGFRHIALVVFALSLMMTGCRRNDAGNSDSNTMVIVDTTTATKVDPEVQMALESSIVLDQVKNIFRVVSEDQRSLSGFVASGLCDKAFCSKSWNKLLMAVQRKEFLTSTLFFELDYWTMTRDPEPVMFEEFEVTNLVIDDNKKSASVSFVVYESSTYVPARVDLVFEDGRWVIDNFHDLRYMLNLRHCMWNYLNHDMIGISPV